MDNAGGSEPILSYPLAMRPFEHCFPLLLAASILTSACTRSPDAGAGPKGISDGAQPSMADTGPGVVSSDPEGETGTPSNSDSGSEPADSGGELDSSLPFDEAIFRSSHNSYSGGERGTIEAQLNAGVRQIELDFHDNDYREHGFRVGHGSPGSEVDHTSPNPSSDELQEWVNAVAEWSIEHSDHSPLHLLLNIKDDMTDNRSTADGSLAALNRLILDAFGERLFWARNLGDDWPTINDLRGKIVVGFTGAESTSTRVAYVQDQGRYPAVAMNDHGQIIEVHQSESHSALWYWTGQLQEDGSVVWWHHGRYDFGREPAIALNNHGQFVEIHRSDGDDDLWYWTGTIGPDGDLQFTHNDEFDTGVRPSVAFDDLDGVAFREIHRSPSDASQNWDWNASIDEGTGTVEWGAHGRTDDDRFEYDEARTEAGWVSVETGEDGEAGINTLLYETAEVAKGRVRYAQIAFIDTNWGDPSVLTEASRFRSFRSGQHEQTLEWQAEGGISRMWKFDEDDAAAVDPPPNFAATDEPLSSWYQNWAEAAGAVQ